MGRACSGDTLPVVAGPIGASGAPVLDFGTGTPVPCAERTAAQCALGGDCRLGRCRAASGNVPKCAEAEFEPHCQTIAGGCVRLTLRGA